jgi:hypothetical protein
VRMGQKDRGGLCSPAWPSGETSPASPCCGARRKRAQAATVARRLPASRSVRGLEQGDSSMREEWGTCRATRG